MSFSRRTIHIVVGVFKYFHFSVAIMAFFLIIMAAFIHMNDATIFLALLSGLITESIIAFGLHTQKHWIVPVLIILSSLTVVRLLFLWGIPSTAIGTIGKIFGLWWAASHIYFFSRQEVREYFKAKKALTLF